MDLSPKQIVKELDTYIIGQDKAKRAVAIALRNRYRRSKLPKEIRDEITPKNIIMKGPTGVGKTEIARRLAKLVSAPFLKIEATKFTEVGYVGRDCESMIRDLVEVAVRLVKEEKRQNVQDKAKANVEQRLVEAIYNVKKNEDPARLVDELKEEITNNLRNGVYDNELIEINLVDAPKAINIMPGMGGEMDFGNVLGSIFPPQRKRKKVRLIERQSERISKNLI